VKDIDLKKRLFALEYFRNGKNAAAAALSVGYSEKSAKQRGYQLLKDEEVKDELSSLNELFGMNELSKPDKDLIDKKIADITEVLMTLTRVIRREEPDENVVVLHKESTDFADGEKHTSREEFVKVVETKTKVSDVNKAADILMKYYQTSQSDDNDKSGGIVILPQINEESEGYVNGKQI
jgi:phage terminase small subunit